MTKFIYSIFIALLLFCSCQKKEIPDQDKEALVTNFYFIRHAEKDRSDTQDKNPHLTEIGHKRAQQWNEIFKHINFDAIYSTDFYRTRETVMPLVKKNSLELSIYDPNTLNMTSLKKDHYGKNILVVGHSNTTPALVNKLIGKLVYSDIEDNNNGNLYVVSMVENNISHLVLEINNYL